MKSNKIKNHCINCNKEISKYAKRCSHCAKIGELNHRFKNQCKIFCTDCGKELSKRAFYYEYKRCSSCEMKRKHKEGLLPYYSGSKSKGFIDGRYLKKYYCIDCRDEISYKTWKKGTKRCQSCAAKENMKHRDISGINNPMFGKIGNKHPNYIDGRSYLPYTAEFTEQLKESIRKRDNFICQNCGMTEEEHLIVIGQVLHIHHIDYNKSNCKEENLITLCSSCNVRANYNRDYWKNMYIIKIIKKG